MGAESKATTSKELMKIKSKCNKEPAEELSLDNCGFKKADSLIKILVANTWCNFAFNKNILQNKSVYVYFKIEINWLPAM